MAKVRFQAEFTDEEWSDIDIEIVVPDKFAWAVYRKLSSKKSDSVEKAEKSESVESAENQ